MKLKPGDLSLCFINRNGARWLPYSLVPLANLCGEVIFVDTGSTDASLEIAANCGARVIEIAWTDDFSSSRNVYLEHAAMPWILALDSDEVLFPGDLLALLDTLDFTPESGVWFTVRHYCRDTGRPNWTYSPADPRLPVSAQGFAQTRNIKLFTNLPQLAYRYPIHESILPDLLERSVPMLESPVVIHHIGLSDLDGPGKKARLERNMRLGMRKIEKFPHDASGYIELAELIIEHGNPGKAIRLLQHAIRLAPGYVDSYIRLGEIYEMIGQSEEAVKIYNHLQDVCPGYARLNAALGRIAYEEGEFDRAEGLLARCTDYLSYVRLSFARLHQDKPEAALEAARLAFETNPGRFEAKIACKHIQLMLQRTNHNRGK